MSIDETIFGWLYRSLAGRRERSKGPGESAAYLAEVAERIEIVGTMLAGQPLIVRPAEGLGGVRGATLLMPECVDLFDAAELNRAVYVLRAAYGVSSRALGFSTEGWPRFKHGDVLATLLAMPATRAHMQAELPSTTQLMRGLLRRLRARAPSGEFDLSVGVGGRAVRLVREALGEEDGGEQDGAEPGALLSALRSAPPGGPAELAALGRAHQAECQQLASACAMIAEPFLSIFGLLCAPGAAEAGGDASTAQVGTPPEAGGSEQQAPRRDELEVIDIGHGEENENPLVHSFEKIHTLDDYKGGSKRHDGEDELDDQMAALEELDLTQVVRTPEPTAAVLKLEGVFEGTAGDVADGDPDDARPHFHYDEWDGRKRQYRSQWCRLFVQAPPRRVSPEIAQRRLLAVRREHARQLRDLRGMLEALELERRWRTRQLDGSEIDIDALVDRTGALAAGTAPDERLYAERRRHERELATLVLLDLSLSSDSYIEDRRVLDVARDALIVLGEVLCRSSDHFAVAGFQSHTRRECRWLPLKSFEDAWGPAVERLLAVEPAGYTRIGPALRHGIRVLSAYPSQRRLLLLVTDAKPTDYDRYEGRYGMDDVRQAFREAEQDYVHPFAVTIAKAAGSTLPRMFGKDRYHVLKRPHDLPAALAEVYMRLAR